MCGIVCAYGKTWGKNFRSAWKKVGRHYPLENVWCVTEMEAHQRAIQWENNQVKRKTIKIYKTNCSIDISHSIHMFLRLQTTYAHTFNGDKSVSTVFGFLSVVWPHHFDNLPHFQLYFIGAVVVKIENAAKQFGTRPCCESRS